jgi:sec-independent protein translocase protein TatC
MTDLVDRARTAVTERAELPGMSLLEHLEELRKRIIHSGLYLIVGFFIAYTIRERLSAFMVKPITAALKAHNLDSHLVYLNPVDPFNFYIKISLCSERSSPRRSSCFRCGYSLLLAFTGRRNATSCPS